MTVSPEGIFTMTGDITGLIISSESRPKHPTIRTGFIVLGLVKTSTMQLQLQREKIKERERETENALT